MKIYTNEKYKDTIFIQIDLFDGILTAEIGDILDLDQTISSKRYDDELLIYSYDFAIENENINTINIAKLNENETEVIIGNLNYIDAEENIILRLNIEDSNMLINKLILLRNMVYLYMDSKQGCEEWRLKEEYVNYYGEI